MKQNNSLESLLKTRLGLVGEDFSTSQQRQLVEEKIGAVIDSEKNIVHLTHLRNKFNIPGVNEKLDDKILCLSKASCE